MLARRSRRSVVVIIGSLLAVAVLTAGVVTMGPWAHGSPSEMSVARRWDEALLDAIRRALPNPPVHARNLFHTSVGMWDAWASYDPVASGYLFKEKHTASDVMGAREEAMSYAAYRILTARFIKATGADRSLSEFDDLMDELHYPLDITTREGDSPAAIGNRIAKTVLDYGADDGSNQAGGYSSPWYKAVNSPLAVSKPGTTVVDPNRWQPLQIEHMISQNGIPVTNGVQQNVGPHWGGVLSFGLPASAGADEGQPPPLDPGPPPKLGDPDTDQEFKAEVVEVIGLSSMLDPSLGNTIDISPGALGGNALGTDDGTGHPVNPVTGKPYEPDVVNLGDFGRIMAEFWADGPASETPPGHWNVLGNLASDELAPNLRVGGKGPVVDRLEWDVKLYLALNGAVHDAAITAWGAKGYYDGGRPIEWIRYMGGLGQSSDPAGPSYDKDGLPLVPDLIEVITAENSAPGQPLAELSSHVGEIAVRSWAGNPDDPKTQVGGVKWILAVNWIPYQLPTFVTPSFPGYFSGHSTFSRAGAEVLAAFTGSEYFPGGMSGYVIKAGSLKFEAGPTTDIHLQWATYFDASDQAGRSRLWGGIHVQVDDFTGRLVGSECGKAAWTVAQRYYSGGIQ